MLTVVGYHAEALVDLPSSSHHYSSRLARHHDRRRVADAYVMLAGPLAMHELLLTPAVTALNSIRSLVKTFHQHSQKQAQMLC